MVAMLKMPGRISPQPSVDERRIFPRKDASGPLESHRMDHTVQARQEPRLTLYLRDLSLGGLSAMSPTPLSRGERLAVFFPQSNGHGGWDAMARVIRCEQSSLGYRIAMEFDPLPAA
ncbi:MAG TPA: PilZ domain-containing protein [Humisphaera sp.]|jgi:hypothetical protein|nr:PilZ domain-containing protein [Humisphaera sp.]